jgi:hypothetical protein
MKEMKKIKINFEPLKKLEYKKQDNILNKAIDKLFEQEFIDKYFTENTDRNYQIIPLITPTKAENYRKLQKTKLINPPTP